MVKVADRPLGVQHRKDGKAKVFFNINNFFNNVLNSNGTNFFEVVELGVAAERALAGPPAVPVGAAAVNRSISQMCLRRIS